MTSPTTTLRRELLTAFALVFAGALMMALAGVLLLLPTFDTPSRALLYMALLLAADIAIFALFGRWLLNARILIPLQRMVHEAEAIADGDYGRRLPPGGARELDSLAESLNRMAGRFIEHQWELTRNIESLEETNRQLTAARDELIRAEKMASLGQLAAGVAHEIGNPLAAILGNMDLLARRAEGRDAELVSATSQQAKRIDRIVRGLLDYSRAREARVRSVDVNAVVRSSVELVVSQSRFRQVEVVTEFCDVPAVAADPFQLEQVMVNLFLNAADAMAHAVVSKDVARVVVRTSTRVHEVEAYLPARRKEDPPGIDYSHRRRFARPDRIPRLHPFLEGDRLVEIRVEDTGPGIPDDLLERVFEPFMTTKEPGKGTGLGLAVCARLIDGMGGTIRAASSENGATFTIVLPAESQSPEASAE